MIRPIRDSPLSPPATLHSCTLFGTLPIIASLHREFRQSPFADVYRVPPPETNAKRLLVFFVLASFPASSPDPSVAENGVRRLLCVLYTYILRPPPTQDNKHSSLGLSTSLPPLGPTQTQATAPGCSPRVRLLRWLFSRSGCLFSSSTSLFASHPPTPFPRLCGLLLILPLHPGKISFLAILSAHHVVLRRVVAVVPAECGRTTP